MNLKWMFGGCCGCLLIMIIISFVTLVGGFTAALGSLFGINNKQESSVIDNSYFQNQQSEVKQTRQETITSTIITVPETNVTLQLTGDTTEYGDFENDKTSPFGNVTIGKIVPIKNGYITTLAVNSGGSGQFYYLASFEKTSENYIMKDYVSLGDRIMVENLSVVGDQVIIVYKQHGPNQAMAEKPDQTVTEVYTLSETFQFNP